MNIIIGAPSQLQIVCVTYNLHVTVGVLQVIYTIYAYV